MRTSLNEIKEIEDHLLGFGGPGNAMLFEAKMIIDPPLRDKLLLQQSTYYAVQQYSRRQLKKEIEAVHQQLVNGFEHQGFMQRIMSLFLKR